MENEVLIALLTKLVDEKVVGLIPDFSSYRGPRGAMGRNGRDFIFEEHEDKIRSWAKEFAIKFEDLTEEQIQSLRGQRGKDGAEGRPGRGFIWDENKERVSEIIRSTVEEMSEELKLKFSDLSDSDIDKLKGPRGTSGRDGRDGRDFNLEEHKEYFETLRPKFTDFSSDDIENIRGPRGRDGRDGRDFKFEDHLDFFNSLRLKFSDLTDGEKESLKLHFSQLTEEEKSSLKLQFKDLTQEDISLIRGPRGMRGQRGTPGRDGDSIIGPMGPRGPIGPRGIGRPGIEGKSGTNGQDGKDGQDAPRIVAIEVEQLDDDIIFEFQLSDGNVIRSDRIKLPAPVNVYNGGGGVRGKAMVNYETIIDEVSDSLTYVGKTYPGNETSQDVWQIQKITVVGTQTIIEFADGNDNFDNIFDNRGSLTYA